MWKRRYYLKIFKITSPSNEFFISGCYNTTLLKHFEILKNKYLEWVVNDTYNKFKRTYYNKIFSFFLKFGVDCEIKLLYEYRGYIKNIKKNVDYFVDGLKNFENCYNLKI